jgi:hypothetical protein
MRQAPRRHRPRSLAWGCERVDEPGKCTRQDLVVGRQTASRSQQFEDASDASQADPSKYTRAREGEKQDHTAAGTRPQKSLLLSHDRGEFRRLETNLDGRS